jgi:hypothetical protein
MTTALALVRERDGGNAAKPLRLAAGTPQPLEVQQPRLETQSGGHGKLGGIVQPRPTVGGLRNEQLVPRPRL